MSTLSINYDADYEREIKDVNVMDTDEKDKPVHRLKIIENHRYGEWMEIETLCGMCFGYDQKEDFYKEKTKLPVTCPSCLDKLKEEPESR